VVAYLDVEARAQLDASLDEAGHRRDLDRVGMEAGGVLAGTPRRDPAAPALLVRSRWRGGHRDDTVVAEVEDHGRWLRWGAPAD